MHIDKITIKHCKMKAQQRKMLAQKTKTMKQKASHMFVQTKRFNLAEESKKKSGKAWLIVLCV